MCQKPHSHCISQKSLTHFYSENILTIHLLDDLYFPLLRVTSLSNFHRNPCHHASLKISSFPHNLHHENSLKHYLTQESFDQSSNPPSFCQISQQNLRFNLRTSLFLSDFNLELYLMFTFHIRTSDCTWNWLPVVPYFTTEPPVFYEFLRENFLFQSYFTSELPTFCQIYLRTSFFRPDFTSENLFSSRFYFRISGDNKDFLSVKFEFRTSSSGGILPQNPIVLVNFTSESPRFLQILPQNSRVSIRFYIRTPYLLSDFTSEPPSFYQILS